jgi:hypothetical protein
VDAEGETLRALVLVPIFDCQLQIKVTT